MPRSKAKTGKAKIKAKASGVAKANGNGESAKVEQTAQMPAQIQLVRKNTKTGEVSPRPRGRPAPDFENGYMKDGVFQPGNPPGKKRKIGRPAGVKNSLASSMFGKAGKMRSKKVATGANLNEISKIVDAVVAERLKNAHTAAMKAFTEALAIS